METDGRYQRYRGEVDQVYWIGGGSCAGKTSIARALGVTIGCEVYSIDTHLSTVVGADRPAHNWRDRLDDRRHSTLCQVMPLVESEPLGWMKIQRQQLDRVTYEIFDLILGDLRRLEGPTVVVEGIGLSFPAVLEVADRDRVVCMIAADDFQRTNQRSHPGVRDLYAESENPERMLATLIDGHLRTTRWRAAEAASCHVRTLVTDHTVSLAEQQHAVRRCFGLAGD